MGGFGLFEVMKNKGILSPHGRGKIKYLWAWLLSMGAFLLCEAFIDEADCIAVESPLDGLLPFSEGFVVFYVLWYFLILGSLIWFALFSGRGFGDFLKYMTVCQVAAIVIFLLFPNKQELRPEALPRENIFASITGLIHSVDTNTNVCPSLHVCYSVAMASVWHREAKGDLTRVIYKILAVLISISTVMIKQHSVVDIFVALPVCAIAEAVTYHGFLKGGFAVNDCDSL